MDVYGSDGEKLGTVGIAGALKQPSIGGDQPGGTNAIVADDPDLNVPASSARAVMSEYLEIEQVPNAGMAGAPGAAGVVADGYLAADATAAIGHEANSSVSLDSDYFRVEHGGVLSIGAKDLYIPYADVSSVSRDRVTVNCGKGDWGGRYAAKLDAPAGSKGTLDKSKPTV